MTKASECHANMDFFATPMSLCRAVIAEVVPADFSPRIILDPAAGSGHWGIAATERFRQATIVGQDVRPETLKTIPPRAYDLFHIGDFLKWPGIGHPIDLVLCNPPYGVNADGEKDRQIVNKFMAYALDVLRPGGLAAFLVRIAVLCGEKRAQTIYKDHPNKVTYILPERPGFTEDGGSENGMGYVVLLFEKGWRGDTIERRLWWTHYPNDAIVLPGA